MSGASWWDFLGHPYIKSHPQPSSDGFSPFIAAAILCATAPASARAGFGAGAGGEGLVRRVGRRTRRERYRSITYGGG